jgi:broad specificity phosphatase PhoE
MNGRRMKRDPDYSYCGWGYFKVEGKLIQNYGAASAFLMEIEDGRFQETFKRLFSTPYEEYDFSRFRSHTDLVDEFKKKYNVDKKGAWICVALLLETDPLATTISRSESESTQALSLPQEGTDDSLLHQVSQDHIQSADVMSDKIVHLFRHAQGEHQGREGGGRILDPFLTSFGIRQARDITQSNPGKDEKDDHPYNPFPYTYLKHPTLILTSPSRRCIQTALYAFHPSLNPDAAKIFRQPPRIIALPHLVEVGDYPANVGSPLDQLERWFGKYVTFPEGLWEHWPKKAGTPFADQDHLCQARAYFVHDFILQQPDKEVVIVSHGDFCHFLVNRWTFGNWLWCNPGWLNQENAQGWPMKLVKKENSEGDNPEGDYSDGDYSDGDYSDGETFEGETFEEETRIPETEKTGLYQLQVFDELKDHVDYCIANIERN